MSKRFVSQGRRRFLLESRVVPSALLMMAFGDARTALAATPACRDGDAPTRRQTAGPFFLPRSPQRTSLLEPGIDGTKVVLSGRVWSSQCRPVAGALLDFWHADDTGEYDVDGFRLRGHQFADGEGRYRLETIVPGLYPGRTRHFHVNVQPPGGAMLTTQLYFPDEPGNARDALFDRRLLVATGEEGGRKTARFGFVLTLA
ncbi:MULTISPECIES: intradiol ring-cleavage dioxygenase [unclassified Caballeronia]|uniref:dioxygenase family protein n=1 Tax=unclassified Caballeronia TaxID=2646786 RepID=UPI002862A0C6|nr:MULTISPECIES: intradiol ring-cleavage dioxygenase [unclassified Caballeronia]MDR5740722.1 intradiol ring-cleavage dioxygenase [Caballeronia sp. LZ016]MDR5808755.1 intradiol ring-cleavage dioxygenase [Caballeronia sp. LZ019]